MYGSPQEVIRKKVRDKIKTYMSQPPHKLHKWWGNGQFEEFLLGQAGHTFNKYWIIMNNHSTVDYFITRG